MLKLLRIGATAALLSMLSLGGHSTTLAASVPVESWMSFVRDDTPAYRMVLPGTHDSAASKSAIKTGDGWVIAQSLSLPEQLQHGIRYLDMRVGQCMLPIDTLCMFHDVVPVLMTFQNAITFIDHFLDGHPSEAIVIRLKVDRGDVPNFQTVVENTYLNNNPDRWFIPNGKKPTDVTLQDLRGKTLIFWDQGPAKITSRFGYSYGVVNTRNDYEFDTPDQLLNRFRDRAASSSRADITGWYENPTSGLTHHYLGPFKLLVKSIIDTAREVVPRAVGILRSQPMFKGIVSMDFPSDELIGMLIDATVSRYHK